MAARALVPLGSSQIEFWGRFQQCAESRVQETNSLAEERLWTTERSAEPVPRFRVSSTTRPDDSVECSFDCVQGMLIVRPGPAVGAGPLQFQVSGAVLQQGGVNLTVDQALNLILDELVLCGEEE